MRQIQLALKHVSVLSLIGLHPLFVRKWNVSRYPDFFPDQRRQDKFDLAEVWVVFKDMVSCLHSAPQWRHINFPKVDLMCMSRSFLALVDTILSQACVNKVLICVDFKPSTHW